jgi:hypothetical protein
MFKKAIHIIKRTFQMLLVVAVAFTISVGIFISVDKSQKFPTYKEMKSLDNISSAIDSQSEAVVLQSRQSILHVLSSAKGSQGPAKMSGTYVQYNDNYYVITAAHGIMGDCDRTFVATDEDSIYDCIKYVIVDRRIDYAIIQIQQVEDRTPVDLTEVIPRNREWMNETSVLTRVFYTGYPNGLGPLTFEGSIAGMSRKNYIFMHSYAWPGSSGSGVFSYEGNLIGIIIALNVGFTPAGYDVLEDLVIVTPLFMIDWDTAYEIMDEPPPSGDTGDTGQ